MVVWIICSLVPPSTQLLPQSLWLGVLLAVIMLARVNAFLALGMLDCTVLISLSAATLALAGIGLAQYLDRQRKRQEQDELARSQEQVMLRLHDDVANRLNLTSIRAHDLAGSSSDQQSRAPPRTSTMRSPERAISCGCLIHRARPAARTMRDSKPVARQRRWTHSSSWTSICMLDTRCSPSMEWKRSHYQLDYCRYNG